LSLFSFDLPIDLVGILEFEEDAPALEVASMIAGVPIPVRDRFRRVEQGGGVLCTRRISEDHGFAYHVDHGTAP
jgi:hypothetical protein